MSRQSTWTVLLAVCLALFAVLPSARAGSSRDAGSPEDAAVLSAVEEFFEAMTACDAEGAAKVLDADGWFFRVAAGEEGGVVTHFDNSTYLEELADCEAEYVERIWNAEVKVQSGIAMVWAPYDLWSDGSFHHCGIDLFNLVKEGERWVIVGGVYTVETENCEESPLGALGSFD